MTYDLTLRIWRGDASGGDLVDYTIPAEDGEVVLDAVHHVQAEQDPHLPALQFHRTAMSPACSACTWWTASRTTSPSSAGIV